MWKKTMAEQKKVGRPRIYEDVKAHRRQYMRDYRSKIRMEKRDASKIREDQAVGTKVGQRPEDLGTDSGSDIQQGTPERINPDGTEL